MASSSTGARIKTDTKKKYTYIEEKEKNPCTQQLENLNPDSRKDKQKQTRLQARQTGLKTKEKEFKKKTKMEDYVGRFGSDRTQQDEIITMMTMMMMMMQGTGRMNE